MKNKKKSSINGATHRPGYQIKVTLTFKNGVTKSLRSPQKSKLARLSVLHKMKSGYLRVEYGPDMYNHGTYYSRKDFIDALNQFTESSLLTYSKGEQ